MIRIPKVTMTMRELDRLKCIQGLIDGQLKQHAVATRLGLTTRQVRRLVHQYAAARPRRAHLEAAQSTKQPAAEVRGRGTRVWDSKVNVRGFWAHIGG
jgi:hypothetical protein